MSSTERRYLRASAVLVALLACIATCCFGPGPRVEDVHGARGRFERFAPIVRAHVAGEVRSYSSEVRVELEAELEAWRAEAERMPADADGFREAELSTVEVLAPIVRDALAGRPFEASRRELVSLKLATWEARLRAQGGT